MKKICYITTVHGTLESFILPIAKRLLEKTDWQITVICNYDRKFEELLPENICYIPVPMKRGISLGGIGAMLKMLRIFRKEKFDLVQYSTPNAALYASIASWLAGIKVRKYHLMGFRYLGFSGVKKWLFQHLEKFTCALSTDIECVSRSNLAIGAAEGLFPAQKAKVLLNGSSAGVDLDRFNISEKALWREQLRKTYGYSEQDCVFGFAGRITKDKGINELFSAFAQIENPNARLFMIGGTEELNMPDAKLLEYARSSPSVTFQGYVDDIERYFAMMDVLVLPSYREGFGNIVIEAQAMGVPVIVSDIPGPTDAMVPGETGLIVPVKDATALRDAMERMASDRSFREEAGKCGRLFVENFFDQQKLCDAILQNKRSLLEQL